MSLRIFPFFPFGWFFPWLPTVSLHSCTDQYLAEISGVPTTDLWHSLHLCSCSSLVLCPKNSSHLGLPGLLPCLLNWGKLPGSACVSLPWDIAWKRSPGSKLDIPRSYLDLGIRDHCSAPPDSQCLKLIISYILRFICLVISSRGLNPILVSLSWPIVEVSYILLELIMNFMKAEENTSFTATGNHQSTRPEVSKVCVLLNNSAGVTL